MALRRDTQKYVINLGFFKIPSTITTHFVSGSPVTVTAGTFEHGPLGSNDWLVELDARVQGVDTTSNVFDVLGIAWFGEEGPEEVDYLAARDHVALLGFPLLATLYKGANELTAPFDSDQTYNVGDLLRPKVKSVGGTSYAVWTNESYGTGNNVYYGKVLAVEGTGANATLVVYFTPIFAKE